MGVWKSVVSNTVKWKPIHTNILLPEDKIIEGKLGKFYSTICLLEQGFIKDPDNTISDLLASKGKELDDEISIRRFIRYGVGE